MHRVYPVFVFFNCYLNISVGNAMSLLQAISLEKPLVEVAVKTLMTRRHSMTSLLT